MTLEHTGERVVEEHCRSSIHEYVIYLMHIATYRFAESFVRARRVLDLGCGSGYGSHRMAEVATTVDAVDVSADAIAHARTEFERENLRFERIGAGQSLPFADAAFDTVVSFQVIEHVTDVPHYLAEIRRVLSDEGCLLVATPDRSTRLLRGQRPWNRWHVREYSAASLRSALQGFFPQVDIQQMSGRPDVIERELRRCQELKWLTLPFTLPLVPDRARVRLLGFLHALSKAASTKATAREIDFDESSLSIGPGLSPSVNLVAVARKGSPDGASRATHPEATAV